VTASERSVLGLRTENLRPGPQASIFDPARLLVLMRRHWIWLLAPPVVFALGAWFLSARSDSRYEATTMVVIRPTAARDLLEGDRSGTLAERELQTEERLLNGPAMELLVSERIGGDVDYAASAVEGTDLLEITAQAGDASGAAEAADGIATLFIDQRRARIQRELDAAIVVVDGQVEELRRELAVTAAGDEVGRAGLEEELRVAETSLDRLRSEATLPSSEARIASMAVEPRDRISPRPSRAAVLGTMLGLLVGLGLVWLRDVLDRRIRGVDDLPGIVGELEFVGPIPLPDIRSLTGPALQVHQDVADRFRVLANASLGGRDERFTIQVTGVGGGEGATFVAANLAAALAVGGWSAAIIDADLEGGDQHRIFQVESHPGTKELLDGDDLDRVIQETPMIHGLGVIATGRRVVADATLLRSRLDELLSTVSRRFDVVVIDGPPILGAGDAAVLATHVDKTILVASANRTTHPDLDRAVRAVAANGGHLTGLVLVEPAARPVGGDGRHESNGGPAQPVTRESIETIATRTSEIPR
jgi:capsular exopolysaccharide synthesis family protein